MFDLIKLAGSIFLILFIILCLVLDMVFHVGMETAIIISAIVSVVVSIVVASLMRGSDTKCPKCGKKFAMKEISRKTASSRATTIDVERVVRNSRNEVVRRYTEAVPATHYIYDCVDECKFCGHRKEVRREATRRN